MTVKQIVNIVEAEHSGAATFRTGVEFYKDRGSWRFDDDEVYDYDERLDVYYHMSDDGDTFYQSYRIVDGDTTQVPVITKDDVVEAYKLVSVLHDYVAGSDIGFAIRITTNPVWLHKSFVETGDLIEAMKLNIKTIFGEYK